MYTLNLRGKIIEISTPIVMGIINTTPDSFYSGSRQTSVDGALYKADQMIADGAAILDIGGQSTRPGADIISPEQECERVLPVLEAIGLRFPETFLSADTYQSMVARKAVEHGASVINDISGGNFDPDMLNTVAALKTPFICMHVKGNADSMHHEPQYEDVVREVLDYFIQQTEKCRKKGIHDIIIDPGFGFSKNSTHNFALLKNLEVFEMLGKPLLLGISRKSTIYKTLGISAEAALNGTTVLHTAGLLKGASILRAHDVKEAMEAIQLVSYLK